MTDYRCMFSTSDRHRKLNQLRWQNVSDHLTNETSYWLKKLPMHLDWAIYNVSDLNIDPHICFFPDLVTGSGSANPVSTARGLSATQREACMCSLTTQEAETATQGVIQCIASHGLCAGSHMMTSSNGNIFRVTELPAQRPVTQSFDVFFDLRLNKRLSKQSWGWWFETLSRPLWRHCHAIGMYSWNWEAGMWEWLLW